MHARRHNSIVVISLAANSRPRLEHMQMCAYILHRWCGILLADQQTMNLKPQIINSCLQIFFDPFTGPGDLTICHHQYVRLHSACCT